MVDFSFFGINKSRISFIILVFSLFSFDCSFDYAFGSALLFGIFLGPLNNENKAERNESFFFSGNLLEILRVSIGFIDNPPVSFVGFFPRFTFLTYGNFFNFYITLLRFALFVLFISLYLLRNVFFSDCFL